MDNMSKDKHFLLHYFKGAGQFDGPKNYEYLGLIKKKYIFD